jgi:hypothetical protein
MENPSGRDKRGYQITYTYTSVPTGSNDKADIFNTDLFGPQTKPVPIFNRSIEEDLKPRELVSDLSQAIYYDSEIFAINKAAIRKYLHEFLFKKFPARDTGVNACREFVVTHVCSEYDELIREAGLKKKDNKKTPEEFKDAQVVHLVRAIVCVKQQAVCELSDSEPETRQNTGELQLKIEMVNALLKSVK